MKLINLFHPWVQGPVVRAPIIGTQGREEWMRIVINLTGFMFQGLRMQGPEVSFARRKVFPRQINARGRWRILPEYGYCVIFDERRRLE